ncbi:hypothetical protein WH43_05890 [Rheinheimera sp. KL1]|uniref:hypothetical protein n=1 Tax=Rheinheimera sp. KL1 TaxID=1635005 RepID=UPI0006A97708|nr:hypothetical protein [Rheinheimera sp. KL1]KOO59109.1 hypothetical protein WH43_05890 [Rheinheimera sp. KL1]
MLFNSIKQPEIHNQWSSALSKRWSKPVSVRAFKPALDRGLAGEWVDNLLSELYPALHNRSKTPTRQALQCALLNLCLADECNRATGQMTGFLCQTTSQSFKTPKRYAVNDFALPKLALVLKDLVKHGYISYAEGFKSKGYDKGLATLFYPTEGFRQRLRGLNSTELKLVWFTEDIELIYLKDDSSCLIDYMDNQVTLDIRQNIKTTNQIRLASCWSYLPVDMKATLRESQLGSESIVFSEQYQPINPRDLICKRVFKGSMSAGGRFYANVQRLTKVERQTIQVDNQPTVEIDIKSLHPRILYNLKGLEAPADCYAITGLSRDIVKKVILVMLNADSEKATWLALRDKHEIPVTESKAAIEILKEVHQPIAEFFCHSSWKLLQYEDSCLTESILLTAMRESIPILPIHDSYITITRYGFRLMDIIDQCYRDRYGFGCVVAFD